MAAAVVFPAVGERVTHVRTGIVSKVVRTGTLPDGRDFVVIQHPKAKKVQTMAYAGEWAPIPPKRVKVVHGAWLCTTCLQPVRDTEAPCPCLDR